MLRHALCLGALLALSLGCAFGGYVPKGPPPKPIPEAELEMTEVTFDEPVEATLDCPAGQCDGRFRMVVPRAGTLSLTLQGPALAEPGAGPRIARVVVEGPGHKTLTILRPDPAATDGVVSGKLETGGGLHYVLVQGIGGKLDYRLRVDYAEGPALAGPAPGLDLPADPAADRPKRPLWGVRGNARVGDIGDGADFAYDPTRDLTKLHTYAFAQDPAALLKQRGQKFAVNPFVQMQVQREVRYALADMGFDQLPANQADFLVSVHGGATDTTWYAFDAQAVILPYADYFAAWRAAGMVVPYPAYQEGTLIIDFVDAKTGKLIWHGWTTEPIPLNVSEDVTLKKAVRTVLAQF